VQPLEGESPLHAWQGGVLAGRQGCPSRGGIRRKPQAKCWPEAREPCEAAMTDKKAYIFKVQYLCGSPWKWTRRA